MPDPSPFEALAWVASAPKLARVGHKELRGNLATVMGQVGAEHAVEVTNGSRREAVLLQAEVFDALADVAASRQALTAQVSGLQLALAAAVAGVSLPTGTLADAGIDLDALAHFRSVYPVRMSHDEHGDPLATLEVLLPADVSFAVDEDELELVNE